MSYLSIQIRFELQSSAASSSGASVVRGCEFKVNNVDPIEFEVDACPNLFTGK